MNELKSKVFGDKSSSRVALKGHLAGLELTSEEVERVAGGHVTNAWPAKIEIGALKAGASEVLYET